MSLSSFIDLIKSGDFLVLDTETTALDHTGEVCQIAIIDSAGKVLLDTLVKPMRPIPASASRIHDIYDEDVKDAPGWIDIASQVKDILSNRNVIIYNADYDTRIIYQTAKAAKTFYPQHEINWHCAMLAYAEFWGDWNDYHGNYRWQSLVAACSQQGIEVVNAHNALADCQMTLALVRKMIEKEDSNGSNT